VFVRPEPNTNLLCSCLVQHTAVVVQLLAQHTTVVVLLAQHTTVAVQLGRVGHKCVLS